MNLDPEDYLRAILEKQEKTNQLLGYLLAVAVAILFLLFGARADWWPLSVVVTGG